MFPSDTYIASSGGQRPPRGSRPASLPAGEPATDVNRILLVDDNPDLLYMTSLLLSGQGFDVVVANNAEEALVALDTLKVFDALITDVVMPGMSGLALADIVAERFPAMRIVLVSGYPMGISQAGTQHRFPMLRKPFRIGEIIALLM